MTNKSAENSAPFVRAAQYAAHYLLYVQKKPYVRNNTKRVLYHICANAHLRTKSKGACEEDKNK